MKGLKRVVIEMLDDESCTVEVWKKEEKKKSNEPCFTEPSRYSADSIEDAIKKIEKYGKTAKRGDFVKALSIEKDDDD